MWNELDEILRGYSKYNKHVSLANVLKNSENLNHYSESFYNEVKKLNNFRNSLVHKTKDISSEEIDNRLSSLKKLVDEFKRVNYI